MAALKWFKFDPSKWIMGRISRLPEDVQVSFIRLCCKYWNDECLMSIENAKLEVGLSAYEKLIDFQIIKLNDDFISISFLDEQFDEFEDLREKRSKAGRASARKRQTSDTKKLNKRSTGVQISLTDVEQSSTDKIREEKIREERNIIPPKIESVISYCQERKNGVNPKKFFDFYTMKGWKVGKEKMKDWQAAVRTWEDDKPRPKRNDISELKQEHYEREQRRKRA